MIIKMMFRKSVLVKSCGSEDEQKNILSSQKPLSAVLQNICKNIWLIDMLGRPASSNLDNDKYYVYKKEKKIE